MRLVEQFFVVDANGNRHFVAAYSEHDSDDEPESAVIFRLNDWQPIEKIDDRTFVTASGETLRRRPRDAGQGSIRGRPVPVGWLITQ